MRLLALAGDATTLIPQIRLRYPLQALAQQRDWTFDIHSFHDCPWHLLAQADVLIVQRGISQRAAAFQRLVRARGGTVVYEIDDLLSDLPTHISNHQAVRAAVPWLKRCLAECDLVTVSTERLGDELAVANWALVPNSVWPPEKLTAPAARPDEPVTLLLASSEALATAFIVPALRSAAHAGARIVAVGPAAQLLAEAGVPVQAQPLIAREHFIHWVRRQSNVVAVIPLEASRFASCKSAIKWFEYSHAGIPVLASAVPPYLDVVQDGVTGVLVPNTAVAWEAALHMIGSDSDRRASLAQAAMHDVRARFSFEGMVEAWGSAIEEAVGRRGQLQVPTLQLAERLHWWAWRCMEAPRQAMRRLNRRRLERRHARRRD